MSAIWGQVRFNGMAGNEIDIMQKPYERKCKLDRLGRVNAGCCSMGCGIQYITKEAQYEQLPYADRDRGICFTADCILDNRAELMEESGICDDSVPDSVLIRNAYARWGMDFVCHIRGQFSIAIWNEKEKTLYLIADQVASRCLYYYRNGDTVFFSTLIEPIRLAVPGIRVNQRYLQDYVAAPGMTPNISSTETAYEGIFKLNPGTWLGISGTGKKEYTYWSLDKVGHSLRCKNAGEYLETFRSLYEECVQSSIRCSGRIGIAMSSGLDSASIGVLASKQLAELGKELYSYTYVPHDKIVTSADKDFVMDEEQDVRLIVKQYPNIRMSFLDNHGQNCYEELDKWVDIMEMPFKAYVNIPNLAEIYRKGAEDGCRVILTGQMGNATVSNGYIDDVLYELWRRKRYITFLMDLNKYCRHVKESRKSALSSCIRYFRHADKVLENKQWTYEPDNPFLDKEVLKNYPLRERFGENGIEYTERIPQFREAHRSFLKRKAMYTYLGEYETKLGLGAGVMLRDPTMDVRMLEFCYQLPYELYAHKGTPRWLIREAFKGSLPQKLLDNWMRYGVQNSDWMQRMERDWMHISISVAKDLERAEASGYVKHTEMKQFMDVFPEYQNPDKEVRLMYLLHLAVLGRFLKNGET